MALEGSSGGIWALNTAWPEGSDDLNQGDDHLRVIKTAIKGTFPNISATASLSASALNFLNGVESKVQTQFDTLSKSLVANIATIDTISASLQAEITRSDVLSQSLTVAISRIDTVSASLQSEVLRVDTLSASLSQAISDIDTISAQLNVLNSYAFMYVHDGSTVVTSSTSLSIFNAWSDVGHTRGMAASTVSGAINVASTGVYQIAANFAFSGVANVTYEFHTFKGDADLGFGTRRKIGSGGDVGSCAIVGEVSANPNDKIYIRCLSDATSSPFTMQFAQFMLKTL